MEVGFCFNIREVGQVGCEGGFECRGLCDRVVDEKGGNALNMFNIYIYKVMILLNK